MTMHYQTCKTLTLAGARAAGTRAAARASALSLAIAIVVVDRSGALLLAEVADGAAPGLPLAQARGVRSFRGSTGPAHALRALSLTDAAMMRAKGAARYRSATHLTREYLKTVPAGLAGHALALPDLCAFQGGVPIKIGDEVIGAIGIAGGSGEQDIAIAIEAAEAVE